MESCVSLRSEAVVWNGYVEMVINRENGWDHDVEGLVVCVCRDEVVQVLSKLKTGKALVPSDV